jgi:hypothetical protein
MRKDMSDGRIRSANTNPQYSPKKQNKKTIVSTQSRWVMCQPPTSCPLGERSPWRAHANSESMCMEADRVSGGPDHEGNTHRYLRACLPVKRTAQLVSAAQRPPYPWYVPRFMYDHRDVGNERIGRTSPKTHQMGGCTETERERERERERKSERGRMGERHDRRGGDWKKRCLFPNITT